VGHLGMSYEAREGALGKREGPTIMISKLAKVLGEGGTSFPLGGVS
jgi:hypothetical protein